MATTVKLTFLGDLMCQPQQIRAVARSGRTIDAVFSYVEHLLVRSDFVLGNLETPVAPVSGKIATGQMTFNAPASFLEAVRNAGVTCVSLANNHCLDQGFTGLDETIRMSRAFGLDVIGAYLTPEESGQLFVKDLSGMRIGIVGSTYGINGLDAEGLPNDLLWRVDTLTKGSITHRPVRFKVVRQICGRLIPDWAKRVKRAVKSEFSGVPAIAPIPDSIHPDQVAREQDGICRETVQKKILTASKQADFVVSFPHVGGQYNAAPGAFQRDTVRWMLDAGADCVIANHAHRPLRSERKGDKFVAFALGNFCFTPGVGYYLRNVLADYSIILHVEVNVSSRKISRVTFNTVKSVVRRDGVAVVMPVTLLKEELTDSRERERLAMENEAVVNCFRGTGTTVEMAEEYTL